MGICRNPTSAANENNFIGAFYMENKENVELFEENFPKVIEFEVDNSFVKQLPAILSNVEKLKQFAEEQTAYDQKLILRSNEDFEQAKSRCADLNRVIRSLEEKRKDVKKAYNRPYEAFEVALKEVTAILTKAKDNLWQQVIQAEEKVKKEKEDELKEYWLNKNCQYRTWEQIFQKSWLNKTTKKSEIFKQLDQFASTVENDINLIKGLQSDFEISLINFYKRGATLGDVLQYNLQLKEEQRINESQREQQACKSKEKISSVVDVPSSIVEEEIMQSRDIQQDIYTIDFRVWATTEQLSLLKDFLKKNEIRYGKVTN